MLKQSLPKIDKLTGKRPVLYSFRRCPYAIRARMALGYAGVEVTLREVLLRDKPAQMLSASPAGTVPVLVISEHQVLQESIDLMRWAVATRDPDQWLPVDKKLASIADRLISSNDGEFKYFLDRYKYFDRYPEQDQQFYRHKAEKFIADLDTRLNENKFLLGRSISIADVAIFPFIRQFAFVDQHWFFTSRYTQLIKWLTHFLDSELFLSVMKKYPPWQVGQPDITFP